MVSLRLAYMHNRDFYYLFGEYPVGFIKQNNLLNQVRAGLLPVHAWFLTITFILPKYVCMCVRVRPRGNK